MARWLARAVAWLFYRIDRVGAPPRSGSVLLLANHPNALLDPAIIWATAGRDVRFLAKSTLFDGPLRPILSGAGAIPVYRRRDEGVDPARNSETFAAVDRALAAGDAVCIFPEGVSHSQGRLVPLRTGAARMALSAAARGTAVALVAVGLNFDRKTAFRSRVTVAYGAPFSATDLVSRVDGEDPETVRALTDRIATHMRRLLIEADPGGDARLVDRIDRLYAAARGRAVSPDERIARRRAIAAGIEQLRTTDHHRYEELLMRLRRYDERLRRFGLRDRHLDFQVSPTDELRFAAREGAIGFLLVPLAVVGLVMFFAPYRLTARAARLATNEPDVAATAKVVSGAVIYLAWFGAIIAALWITVGGTRASVVALLIPFLAVAALFAIERESAVLETVRAWWVVRHARTGTRALRRRRSELADVLDDVYQWLKGSGGQSTAGR